MTPPGNIHLLIVDGDALQRHSLVRRFERLGGIVTETGAAGDALEKAARRRCDVARIDLNLPDMDGLKLLARLKERQPDLEAVVLTGHGSIEAAIRAMKSGAYDYLTKPVPFPAL
jgi:DNA-binding NtrC family response regulator